MQKYGWRFFPVIQTGAGQTYQTRAGAMGNYGMVDLECKKQILLWACPTPTKGNCWCCLRTAGGVPTPHGSAVESHWVSLFFLLHIRIGLVLTVMYWLFILLQTPTLFTGGQMYCWILHINKISIVGYQKKKKKNINIEDYLLPLTLLTALQILIQRTHSICWKLLFIFFNQWTLFSPPLKLGKVH